MRRGGREGPGEGPGARAVKEGVRESVRVGRGGGRKWITQSIMTITTHYCLDVRVHYSCTHIVYTYTLNTPYTRRS